MSQGVGSRLTRSLGILLAAFCLVFVLAIFGILLTRAAGNVAVFWPANAAIVCLGLFVGTRRLPELLAGAMLGNGLAQFYLGDPLLTILGLPIANAFEIALILMLFKQFEIGWHSINDPNKALKFVGSLSLGAFPAAMIGALIVNLAVGAPFISTGVQWWAGDVVSHILVLLPILSYKQGQLSDLAPAQWTRRGIGEFIIGMALFASSMSLLGSMQLPPAIGILLPLLWIALRQGVFATAIATTLFILLATTLVTTDIWHSAANLSAHDEILQLHVTSMLCALPAFFVAASISSRNMIFEALSVREQEVSDSFYEVQVALANMKQGISCFDAQYRLTIWNAQYCDMFGMSTDDVDEGTPFLDLLEMQKAAGNFEGAPVDLQNKIIAITGQGESLSAETEVAGRIIHTVHAPNPHGGWIATHEDVTEKRRIEKNIEYDALHDALTGLPNRRYHEQELQDRAAKCHETGGGVALLHIDLDRFKEINDTLGHAAGDAMLIHAANVLRSFVREGDFVARIGGDEFVAVCNVGGSIEFLSAIANRIIEKMHQPVPFGDQMCRFGVSIGISHQQGKKVDAKQLLINADIALYRAKNRGRGCFEYFTEALHTEVVNHKRLSDEIIVGIERAQFVNFYQPQIDARTNEVCGVEALVRWEHPTRGLLTPEAFIGIAEEIDQVAMIDQLVLQQTLEDMVRWEKQGLCVPHASVNVSARRLSEPGLLEHLRTLDIPPGKISFELMESIYLDENDENLNWTIDQIKDLGIDIELDDFGTGHTSIVSLHAIKPKRLKIDRRLVIPIIKDASRLKIITSVIDIGKALDIVAVAEGVETMEHTRMLVEAGCYLMQGYGYSKPLSAPEFENYIREESWKLAV